MSMFKNINVVSYSVRDWERAKKFYGEVLEWPVNWASDELGWIEYGRDGETHISISRWESPDPLPVDGPILVFSVDDARAVIQTLRAKGVRCDDAIEVPGVVVYGTFYDPEGNRLQAASSAAGA